MAWAVWINATDVSTLGFYVEQAESWLAGPDRTYAATRLPGRMGSLLSAEPEVGERTLRLTGSIVPSDNLISTRATYEKRLKALAYQGLVTVTLDDDVNAPLRIDAVCERFEAAPKAHPMTTPNSKVSVQFRCPDPTFYDLQSSILAFGTTATPCPTGNAPHGGIIRIAAPAWSAASVTNPTLTYMTAGGATVTAMAFTGVTLVAGEDFLEIDLDRATVTLSDAGVRSNAISTLTAGNTFFSIDPTDGDYVNAGYPQLKVAVGAGTPSCTLTYARRWL